MLHAWLHSVGRNVREGHCQCDPPPPTTTSLEHNGAQSGVLTTRARRPVTWVWTSHPAKAVCKMGNPLTTFVEKRLGKLVVLFLGARAESFERRPVCPPPRIADVGLIAGAFETFGISVCAHPARFVSRAGVVMNELPCLTGIHL